MKKIILIIPILILAACAGKNSGNHIWQQKEGLVWNTAFHITYEGAPELADSVIAVLDRVGKSLSVFDTASLVTKVNMGDSVGVNTDFIRVYIMSKKINKISDGLFDPTISPMIDAWGFGKGHKVTADTARIDSIKKYVGLDKTRLRRDAILKDDPRITFNFSAIAKGYGCDAVGEMLESHGVKNYLIEIGGEIMMKGKNQQGGDWRISVDRPIVSDSLIHESQEIIQVTDMGVATSGNYRNFHEENGQRYGHTISPVTGRPVKTDVLSATVLAPSAMEADGLATAFMAMGSAKSKEVAGTLKRPVLLVLADSTVWMSEEFEKLIIK